MEMHNRKPLICLGKEENFIPYGLTRWATAPLCGSPKRAATSHPTFTMLSCTSFGSLSRESFA
jgi:hypothetical protein